MTQDIRDDQGDTGALSGSRPSGHAASGVDGGSRFDPARMAFTPLSELFDLLRSEVNTLCARAYRTKDGWSKYTVVGELVETLARRTSGVAASDLVTRLRSPDYRISAETLHEAADVIEASAMSGFAQDREAGLGPEGASAVLKGDARP